MGHSDIAVLDGGLPKWQAEGHPTEDMAPVIRDRHMTVRRQKSDGTRRDTSIGGIQTWGL